MINAVSAQLLLILTTFSLTQGAMAQEPAQTTVDEQFKGPPISAPKGNLADGYSPPRSESKRFSHFGLGSHQGFLVRSERSVSFNYQFWTASYISALYTGVSVQKSSFDQISTYSYDIESLKGESKSVSIPFGACYLICAEFILGYRQESGEIALREASTLTYEATYIPYTLRFSLPLRLSSSVVLTLQSDASYNQKVGFEVFGTLNEDEVPLLEDVGDTLNSFPSEQFGIILGYRL